MSAELAQAVGDDERPLVVTLALDDVSQQRLDGLRRAHFPADRNHLPAHVTLFHALPGRRVRSVRHLLADAAQEVGSFDVRVGEVMRLGRGTALRLASGELEALHARLLSRLRTELGDDALTAQDRHRLRPHVTVQNKVDPARARALAERLEVEVSPWTARAAALELWRYDGGPWSPVETLHLPSP
ncbi:2'-5' RNA ligase superfamily protein [Quadrisphaera granulorum]|uniref:2'-5' RNA ligase superfamily protein n=1 Tax=Quadrisphaera granulorum TaxID=317664 RepID=A0A316A7Y6_9ACTN|nr:2'-5' RNA ligase family protein [Quadrisphaera granulorum]PWJ53825.1 2'-5' RNA ligase superfamily protein [Quadrisphaera granulorum]SZE96582.1 2'-5' RNA ligase superfamily protein [Quadrisphaera granulorum]